MVPTRKSGTEPVPHEPQESHRRGKSNRGAAVVGMVMTGVG